MNYEEALEKLKSSKRAYRKSWNTGWTNEHIFFEGEYLMKTTCDWPETFRPTDEDKKATDWDVDNIQITAPK
jgi:hypothetical protein